jgi:excisionase family DNA binding protein
MTIAIDNLPIYLTPNEAAELLRTTRKAIYVKIERRQIPGVRRIGKKILIRSAALLEWIEDQQGAHSLQGDQR